MSLERISAKKESPETLPNFVPWREAQEVREYKEHLIVPNMERMPRLSVGCGRASGLPFEYLMTDIYSGCLPIRSICYANCTAAEFWINKGYDFGNRVLNDFEDASFGESVSRLPSNQKWLRQGWSSDVSIRKEGWGVLERAARIAREHDVRIVTISKIFNMPTDETLATLADTGMEIRASISAIDSRSEIDQRLTLLKRYKEFGGFSVPYLMSALYSDDQLTKNQDLLVDWIRQNDFVAAEHPLRLNRANPVREVMADGGFWHTKFPNEYWFGRLFDEVPNFLLPPPTCLKPEYQPQYKSLSEASGRPIENIGEDLPTNDDLKEGILTRGGMLQHATYE